MPIKSQSKNKLLLSLCLQTKFLAVTLLVFTLSQFVGISSTSFAQKIDPYTGAHSKDSTLDDSTEKKTVINGSDDDSTPSGSISEGYSFGQAEPDFYTLTDGSENGNSPRRGNGGAGSWIRLGHLANKTIGRDESITHIELFPYLFNDHDGVLFGNLRFFRTNEGNWGGNGGVGYRKYLDRFDRFLGGSVYFDRDGSRGENFEQLTVSLESIGTNYDWRMNLYMPFGAEQREIANTFNPGSARFVDRNLVFDSTRTLANAYKGFDMELGFPLHSEFANKHDIRAFAGWYLFRDDDLNDIAGWKTRLSGNVIPSIDWNFELTRDNTFDTRIQFGAAWTFNPHKSVAASKGRRRTTWERMTIPVERLYNIVTATQDIVDPDQVAINPDTGTPYVFSHVNSTVAGPGTGNVLDPFMTIQDAQSFGPPHDIIFVHAESVFNGADANVTALANIRILGEAADVTHQINVRGPGLIDLPSATGGVNRPVLNNSTGNGVTLESGSEFSGFVINNPTNDGIFADTITGATVRNVDVNTANGGGVVLNANTGSFLFSEVVVTNPVGNALQVTGGNASISILDSVFTNNSNRLIIIDSITGGFVNLSASSNALPSTVTDNGGSGILVNNTAGAVTISGATLNNSIGNGIDVQDTIGSVNFIGPTLIDGAAGNSFNVENTLAGSSVSTSGGLTINNRNMTGINLRNISGTTAFADTTTIGTPVGLASPAIDFQNSSGSSIFEVLNVNGSGVAGINIGEVGTENTGSFTVTGTTTIANNTGTALAIQNDSSNITFNGLTINDRVANGIVIDEYNGTATFNLLTNIANQGDSLFSGLIINNTTANGSVNFTALNVQNAQGAAAVSIEDNLGPIGFNSLNIESIGTTGLFANNNMDGLGTTLLSSGGGTIASTDGSAVDISNSGIDMVFESVGSTNSTFGIGLNNNTGSFEIVGLGNGVFGDGGFLTGHTTAAILLVGTDPNEEDYRFNELSISQANEIGVRATEIDVLQITTSEIIDSDSQGIFTTNVESFLLEDSSILRNGNVTNTQSILKEVNRVLLDENLDETFYTWDIFNSIITHDADNDAILYQVAAGGQGAMLDASIGTIINLVDNDQVVITTSADGVSGFRTEWNGLYFGDIHRTVFQATGDNATGILFDNNDTTDTVDCPAAGCTNLVVQNSLFQMTGGNATGASFETSSFTLLDIISNQVDLTGGDSSIGMRFNLAPDSQVLLQDNIINDLVDEGTGFLFSPTNGPLSTVIQGNVITLNTTDFGTFETAFNFQAVTGTINLSGTTNNVFNFGNSLVRGLFGPFGSFNGQILINNTLVP